MHRVAPRHKNDFDALYDLADPAPYFHALAPADYRMPWVLAEFLHRAWQTLAHARGRATLAVIDFACGYGTNGALLRHEMSMRELYTHFGRRDWLDSQGRAFWASDRQAFAGNTRSTPGYHLTGVDIALNALEYAKYMGFVDEFFTDDLIAGLPGAELGEYLGSVDLVIESGAISTALGDVCRHIITGGGPAARPWFLHCPRPDVDWAPLVAYWRDIDYETFALSTQPIRYRKALSDFEHNEIDTLARSFGLTPARIFRDGYMCVDLMMAAPRGSVSESTRESLTRSCEGLD